MSNTDKRVVLVVGTPRSGTSAIAGALQKAGIPTAAKSWAVHSNTVEKFNPEGTWECSDLHTVCNHSNLFVPPYFQYNSSEQKTSPAEDLIKEYIHFRDTDTDKNDTIWAAKDPRLTFLGIEFLAQLGKRVRFIFAQRSVFSSATSYAKMRGYEFNDALKRISHSQFAMCYLYHITPEDQKIEVRFPELLGNPSKIVNNILDFAIEGVVFHPDRERAIAHISNKNKKTTRLN
jgi:hypothetical protein